MNPETKPPTINDELNKPITDINSIIKSKEDLDKLLKTSKGRELIKKLSEKDSLFKNKIIPEEEYGSIIKDGVEVLDVKAIKKLEQKKDSSIGIPLKESERKVYKI